MATLEELNDLLGGDLAGDGGLKITGAGSLDDAGPGDLAPLDSAAHLEAARGSKAGVFLVDASLEAEFRRPVIRVKGVLLAFNRVIEALGLLPAVPPAGVHATAVVDGEVHASASIGPHCVVQEGARIGARTVLGPHVVVERGASVGEDCVLDSGVCLNWGVRVGNRVRIGSNSVVGSEGFAYVPGPEGPVHLHHLGIVELGDDVEMAAGCAIDRARFGATKIARHAKLDNLVHIGHNCTIGERSLIAGQVGMAGSAVVGSDCMFGGQVGISDHCGVGDRCMVGAQAGVIKTFPDDTVLWGTPARARATHLRELATLARLSRRERRKG